VYLLQLAAQHEEIEEAGGAVLGIGPSAAQQARHLMESRGIPFPLLLDTGYLVAGAIELGRQPLLRFLFHPGARWRWQKNLCRGHQGVVTGPWWEVPGVVLLDARSRVVWAYRGRFIGDYPPIEETTEHLMLAIEAG
jgi:hypothetical protein